MDNNYNNQGNDQNNYGQQNSQNQNQNYQQQGYNYSPNNMNQAGGGQGFSIASMVCGILSIVFCWCYGVVGLILGIVALAMYSKSKELDGGVPNGMAKAGLVCGIIGAVLSAIYVVLWIIGCVIGSTADSLYWYRHFF